MAACALSHWNHLCTCSHKLSWAVRHDMIFKNSIKSYAWKTGHSLFPGSPSSLDLVPGRKQPVKTSAPVSSRSSEREQHMLHMLEELWKSVEQHVLVLKKQLSLHLHSDGSATLHLIFSSSSARVWWDFGVLELPLHRFSAGVCAINSLLDQGKYSSDQLPHSFYPWKLLITKECSGKGADKVVVNHRGLNKGPGLVSVWDWEYLLFQTSAACHTRLYYVQLGHSGTLSDALYIFALTDLKGQSMKSMAMNMGQQKRNVFSLSTGTCCHRRLQKQMLWMDIKTWNV